MVDVAVGQEDVLYPELRGYVAHEAQSACVDGNDIIDHVG